MILVNILEFFAKFPGGRPISPSEFWFFPALNFLNFALIYGGQGVWKDSLYEKIYWSKFF